MDFPFKVYICIQITLLFWTSGCYCTCHTSDGYDCAFNVTCLFRPSSVNTLVCGEPPNVTFIIKLSSLDTLTSGFFSATNFDSRVRQIVSLENNWQTIESHAFKFYTRTLSLNLTATGIININNDAFLQLAHLKSLDLSNNKIERLNDRSLYLVSDNELVLLDLSRNKITHLQDDVFTSLTKLLRLYLQNNRLTTMSIDCFSNLKSLGILFLENNNLTSLGSNSVHLRELKFLDLSNNHLKKLSGFEINRLTNLVFLNVSYNAIESVDFNCFSLAQNLQYLDLSHNEIRSSIETVMFMNNHLLQYLNLYENKMTTIKELSFQFNAMTYLNVERNNLSITINRDILKGLLNLKSLNITQQNITAIKENAFTDMQYLQFLNLSRNNIETVDNTSFEFENTSALITLDLSFNYISELHFLQYFHSELKEFYINNNKLRLLRMDTFRKHTHIVKLDISDNEILIIERHSLPLSSLQYLHINKNKLTGNITKNMFSPAPFLRYLDIDNLQFQRTNENAFEDLNLLTKLNLSNNQLDFIDPNNFINMDKMYSLDLSHNKLSELSVNNLDKLKAIYLNNNNFTTLPKLFSNNSEVLYIDISNNLISETGHAGFINVRNVTVLKMSNNGIKSFNSEETNNLTKLSDLILSSNKISEIKLTYFEGLVSVDLSNNSISFINDTILDNLHSLQYLDLSINNISSVPPGSFQHLKMLKLLNLSSNYITNLRYGTFRGLAKTETIDVSNNKIAFLDVNIFHECNELKKLIIDYNFIKTVDVDKLIYVSPNVMSLSLGGNPISCEEIVRNNRLKDSRKFEVTSIHQIFHEDNVHGIKCGDISVSPSTEKPKESQAKIIDDDKLEDHATSAATSHVLLIWCCVLTTLAISGLVYVIYSKRGKIRLRREEPCVYQRSSINVSSADFSNDLLG